MSKIKDRNPGKIVGHLDRQLFGKVNSGTAPGSPIVFMGNGAWNQSAAMDGTDPMYGMPAGTTPDVKHWPPIPGDSYVDMDSGTVISFTGPENIMPKLGAGPTSGVKSGFAAGQGVLEILDDPTNRITDNFNIFFIVGQNPIGAFVGHEGQLAHAGLQKWIFEMPSAGLVAEVQYPRLDWTFDGSRWTSGTLS